MNLGAVVLTQFDEASLVRLTVRGRALIATQLAAVLWTAGWIATEASAWSQAIHYGWRPGGIVFIALWTLVGVVALVAIIWAAAGRPEVVTVSGRALELTRGIGPFGRTLCFDASVVRALRVFEAGSRLAADYAAIRAFWDRGAGRIGFDVNGRTYAFGPSLDDQTIHVLCSAIATRLPAAVVQPVGREPDEPRASRRRLGWVAHVTGWMIVGAVSVPTRTLVTDFPTCTGGAFGAAYQPLDRSRLHGNGRIVLAPFGDFPAETARLIAEHFKQKYSLDIDVGPPLPLPDESFDPARGQLDSDILLVNLARAYPQETVRTIVIGLTSADMFIRDVSWAYAFSNRLPPRFAVVSSARMDRGCMGIRVAEDATQVARLRKMIGKNIGVLFYRLPLSNHPRSMMYGSIGGPQELDAMLEEF